MFEFQRLQWSPDGTVLYYHKRSDDRLSLWKRTVTGGEPEEVTHFEDRLADFEWSPDGTQLAGSRTRGITDAVLITGVP